MFFLFFTDNRSEVLPISGIPLEIHWNVVAVVAYVQRIVDDDEGADLSDVVAVDVDGGGKKNADHCRTVASLASLHFLHRSRLRFEAGANRLRSPLEVH